MNNTHKNCPAQKVFFFKQEWIDVLSEMSQKVRLQVYEAVMMYQATGEVPEEMTKVARLAFYFIRKEIDRMNGDKSHDYAETATSPSVERTNPAQPVKTPSRSPLSPDGLTPDTPCRSPNTIPAAANRHNLSDVRLRYA